MEALLEFVNVLLQFVPPVAGGAIAIAAIVDGLKKLGWLPDGRAQLVSLALNAVLFGVVYFLGERYGGQIDGVLAAIVSVAPVLVSLLLALGATKLAHKALKAVGLGYSHPVSATVRAG